MYCGWYVLTLSLTPNLNINNYNRMEPKGKNEETIIVYDWDDTLLPSSFLAENKTTLTQEELRKYIIDVEGIVFDLISLSLNYGKVYVVTNSETGWVKLTCERFYPKLLQLLDEITIISARSTYQHKNPNCQESWKYFAFCDVILTNPYVNHIIAFGDNMIDRNSIRAVVINTFSEKEIILKNFKLIMFPTPMELGLQLKHILNNFPNIVNDYKHMDMQINIKC
jgi:hypothetical protein